MSAFKITRFCLYPVIIVADFLQTNFTRFFTPMNMGPVNTPTWSETINYYFDKKDFVLDFGCGVGFFSKLFDHQNYIGLEINKKFLERARTINSAYNFSHFNELNEDEIKDKIDGVLINNVLHHLSDDQISKSFEFLRRISKNNSKILIIEPLFPKKFFSLEFFMKALDIGNYIRTEENYKNVLRKSLKIEEVKIKKFGISNQIILFGKLLK